MNLAATLLWTALATSAFALRFGLRARDLLPTSVCAASGWLVFALASGGSGNPETDPRALGYFVAALSIGILAELLAVATRKPATVYVVTGILPLVPGGGMYYTMLHAVQGDLWSTILSAYVTLTAAGALASGLAVSSALSRLLSLRAFARRIAATRERFPLLGAERSDSSERKAFDSLDGRDGGGG